MPLFPDPLEVKFHGFLNKLQYFFAGLSSGDATWNIWDVSSKAGRAFFNDD